MTIGCSVCGWKDLTVYKSYMNVSNLILSVFENTKLTTFEIPFLGLNHLDYLNDLKSKYPISFFSVHASKTIFQKSNEEIIKYFYLLNKFCSVLDCKCVVVHPPDIINIFKLKLAISLLTDATISIENVTNEAFNLYLESKEATKMCMDLSHYLFLKQSNIFSYIRPHISHWHIRGYSENKKYTRLCDKDFIESNKLDLKKIRVANHSNILILEYPYDNVSEIKEDIELIHRS